jgi:guanylate kinase
MEQYDRQSNRNIAENVIIISGPSGVGEDSVIDGLRHILPIERVVTTTTREPREGEAQGNPYYFISPEAFRKHIAQDELVEYAQEYNDHFYGVTRAELERVSNSGSIGIWKIEWRGVITAKQLFPGIVAIFLTVSDLAILERRIRRRKSDVSEQYVRERMEYTREWMKHTDIYDYTVFNEEGKLDETIAEIAKIIRKRSRLCQDDPERCA